MNEMNLATGVIPIRMVRPLPRLCCIDHRRNRFHVRDGSYAAMEAGILKLRGGDHRAGNMRRRPCADRRMMAKDAEAICAAASQPHIPVVPKKTVEQQDIQGLHRGRKRMVNHRTASSARSAPS